ncbi:phage tail tape measure protein [Bacillus haynesii]|uniref:phage tail tape measure protein n=1 Tax=Bacillus haynesii TaxID=1925021 RepID=UPI00227E5ACE|nr:phage tail tape measure protein [Bacillus haynesii]MCY7780088.1 phage tail tape measure protein [Bacillus haynesii]MEC0669634.1 phage tail tape measure protein [Bacillus haynesii]
MADHTINVRIGATITDLTRELNQAQSRLEDFGSRLSSMGQNIAMGFGAIAAGVGGGLGLAVNKAMDFEQQMSNVKAVSGATGDEMKKLTDLAVELGAKTKYSSLEAGQGIEELMKAGVSTADILSGGLAGALDLATAGELDLSEAAEIASTALNAFRNDNLSVTDAANMLAGAANASATNVHELKYGLSMVSAVASGVGLSFKDTSTALAVFAQNGLKGSDAGTSLKTMLLNLTPASEAAYGQMLDLGLITKDGSSIFYDAKGNLKSFAEIAQILQDKLKGLTKEQQQAALKTMFGTDAIRAANIMMKEGAKGANAMWKSMSKVTAAEVAAEKMNNLKGQIEELSGATETAQIAIGNALIPALSALVRLAQKVVDGFNNLSPGMQKFITYAAAAAAVVAGLGAVFGVLLIFVGSVITSIGAISGGLTAFAKVLGTTRGALLLTMGQFALISAAVIALGIAFAYAYKHSDVIREKITALGEAISRKVSPTVDKLTKLFKGLAETLTGDFTQGSIALHNLLPPSVANSVVKGVAIIRGAFDDLKKAFSDAFNGDFSGLAEFIPNIIGIIVGGIPGLIVAGSKYLPAIAKGIEQNMPKILETATKAVESFVDMIVTNLPKILQAGIQIIQSLLNGFTQALPNILASATQIINSLVQAIVTLLPALIGAGILIITSLIQGVVEALPQIIQAGTTMLTTLINTIVTLLPTIIQAGIQILNSLISGIIQALPQLIEAALQLILALANAILENLPTIINAGIQILTSLINGIIQILPQLIEMAIYLIVTVAQALIENLPKIIDAGIQLLLALIDGIIQMLPTLVEAALKLIVALAGALIENLPKIIDAGIRILLALIDGIIQILPQLLQTGLDLVVQLGQSILNNKDELFKAGADLIRGLWDGISSMKDWIGEKIGGFVDSVTSDFKSFFGIHSPSRLFRDEIGKFLPMGLAVGIERNIGVVKAAANEMANAALINPQSYAVNPSMAFAGGTLGTVKYGVESGSGVEPKQQQPIVIENVLVVDSEELGRMTENAVSAEQGQKITIQNYMRGD